MGRHLLQLQDQQQPQAGSSSSSNSSSSSSSSWGSSCNNNNINNHISKTISWTFALRKKNSDYCLATMQLLSSALSLPRSLFLANQRQKLMTENDSYLYSGRVPSVHSVPQSLPPGPCTVRLFTNSPFVHRSVRPQPCQPVRVWVCSSTGTRPRIGLFVHQQPVRVSVHSFAAALLYSVADADHVTDHNFELSTVSHISSDLRHARNSFLSCV